MLTTYLNYQVVDLLSYAATAVHPAYRYCSYLVATGSLGLLGNSSLNNAMLTPVSQMYTGIVGMAHMDSGTPI
jgi:hypothetical protein